MIIFELDEVIADIEHRRHFIDVYQNKDYVLSDIDGQRFPYWFHQKTGEKWQSDWQAYFEACSEDDPITEVVCLLQDLNMFYEDNIEIWTTRSENVRDKTMDWIYAKITTSFVDKQLKMRAIGDDRPAHVIKEEWINTIIPECAYDDICNIAEKYIIKMVFESDPESIAMYRRNGIFVFDCRQDV
jgi:hypothetical protein